MVQRHIARTAHVMILLDKPYARIAVYTALSSLELEWRPGLTSTQYRNTLELALQQSISYRCSRWLANNRYMSAISPDDQQWTIAEWMPRLTAQEQIEKLAIVVSADVNNRLDVQNIIGKAMPMINFTTQYFHALPQAWNWLAEGQPLPVSLAGR